MYARGRFRCARSATLEGLRGVTRNVTRFGKHNYMRSGSVACHCVDIYAIKERKRAKQKKKEKRCTKILSPWKNIARCVIHERAYDSRRVNRLWVDAIKQKSVQKNSELEILLCSWCKIDARVRKSVVDYRREDKYLIFYKREQNRVISAHFTWQSHSL